MEPHFNPVDFAVPAFVVLVLIEMVWAKRRAPAAYEPADTLVSLAFGLGSTVAGLLSAGMVAAAAVWLYQHRLVTVPWTWWAWAWIFLPYWTCRPKLVPWGMDRAFCFTPAPALATSHRSRRLSF